MKSNIFRFFLQINVYIYIISLPNSLQDFQFKFQIQNSKGLSVHISFIISNLWILFYYLVVVKFK